MTTAHPSGIPDAERAAGCRHHRRQRLPGFGPRRCLRIGRVHGPSPGSVPGPGEQRPLLRPELGRFVRCPRWCRPARPLCLRHGADQQDRHLAVERLRHRRAVRPGRVQRSSTDHRAVVDVGVSGDTSALRSGQARDRSWRPGLAGCASSARAWSTEPAGVGWPGRCAGWLPFRCFPTSVRERINSPSQSTISRPRWSPWPAPSDCPPSRWASPIPSRFPSRNCSTSFAASQGKPRPRFVPTPPMAVYGALRADRALAVQDCRSERTPSSGLSGRHPTCRTSRSSTARRRPATVRPDRHGRRSGPAGLGFFQARLTCRHRSANSCGPPVSRARSGLGFGPEQHPKGSVSRRARAGCAHSRPATLVSGRGECWREDRHSEQQWSGPAWTARPSCHGW